MISEKTFCSNFSNFWRDTLPNLESVVRAINLGYERVSEPRSSRSSAMRRDLISESGYRLFFRTKSEFSGSIDNILEEVGNDAFEYIKSKDHNLWNEVFSFDFREETEVIELRNWLMRYFSILGSSAERVVKPVFKGHGILSSCIGDFATEDMIIEMKYVERNFRGSDVRQLLTYSALYYFDVGNVYNKVFLVNPLKGIHFGTTAGEIINSASGLSEIEFFNRMSYALSSGEISH